MRLNKNVKRLASVSKACGEKCSRLGDRRCLDDSRQSHRSVSLFFKVAFIACRHFPSTLIPSALDFRRAQTKKPFQSLARIC
jgi:hypothetical protein